MNVLASLVWIVSAVVAGLVVGFCCGGVFGPHLFGRGGLASELRMLFVGAALGLAAGIAAGIAGAVRWSVPTKWRACAGATGTTLLVAGATWAYERAFGW